MSTPTAFSFLCIPRPPRTTLFPYTTLFRSGLGRGSVPAFRASLHVPDDPELLEPEQDDIHDVQLVPAVEPVVRAGRDRKSTRLNSSHTVISYAVFCLKKKRKRNSTLNCTAS